MLTANLKEEFKNLCFQLESLENQLYNTFNLNEKENLRQRIEFIKKEINNILDKHNDK